MPGKSAAVAMISGTVASLIMCSIMVVAGVGSPTSTLAPVAGENLFEETYQFPAYLADDQALKARVEQAFNGGDVRALTEMFADQVEIIIMGEGSVFSRSQAAYVMRDFFRAYPPERFSFEESSRSAGSHLAMGNYWVRAETQPHRVFVRFRLRDERWEVKEIRIESQTPR